MTYDKKVDMYRQMSLDMGEFDKQAVVASAIYQKLRKTATEKELVEMEVLMGSINL